MCFYCGSIGNLSLDHIVPQATQLNHSWDNLITACRSCNSSKGDRTLAWFIARLNISGKNTTITIKQVKEQASKPVQ